MLKSIVSAALLGFSAFALTACGGNRSANSDGMEEVVAGGVNPFLWRTSLDTLGFLPIASADPVGGVIIFDWKSYEDMPTERLKATVFILDTRLRADGISVQVFRQQNQGGQWVDVSVDQDTGPQLENQILNRARQLRVAQLN